MRTSQFIAFSVSSLALLDGVAAQRSQKSRQAGVSTTAPGAAPTTSAAAGADPGGATLVGGGQPNSNSNGNPTQGQAPSLTDANNFINFCKTKNEALTNGLQNTAGSCNPIPMGQLPAKAQMISTVITNPVNGANIPTANTPFDITLTTTNLQAGTFTNPNLAYYTAPQQLNGAGQIIGHVHVTVQNMGADINNPIPPDPTTFAFFKGIDDAGDGQGHLKAVVTAGLPAGNYRICTLVAAANHQPVTMPVAQRGAQDDCVRITVGGAGTGAAAGGGAAAAKSSATTAAAAAGATTPAAVAKGAAGTTTPVAAAAGGAATTSGAAAAGISAGVAAGKPAGGDPKRVSDAGGKSSAAAQANTSAVAAPAAATTSAGAPAAASASASASASPAAGAGGRFGKGRGRGGRGRHARRLSDDEEDDEVMRERFVAREFIV